VKDSQTAVIRHLVAVKLCQWVKLTSNKEHVYIYIYICWVLPTCHFFNFSMDYFNGVRILSPQFQHPKRSISFCPTIGDTWALQASCDLMIAFSHRVYGTGVCVWGGFTSEAIEGSSYILIPYDSSMSDGILSRLSTFVLPYNFKGFITEECCFLGCVHTGSSLADSLPWRWRRYIPPKLRFT
jgi:hypothetical protein